MFEALRAGFPPSAGTASARRPAGTAWLLLAVWLAGALYLHGAGFNQDTSWLFVATRAWLSGATLYADIMEVNPPLIFYLTAPAAWAELRFGVTIEAAFRASLLLLTLISAGATLRILETAPGVGRREAPLVAVAALAIALFGALPQDGQREHLLVLFTLPYLTLLAYVPEPGALPRRARIAIAVFAALGLLLKPHFLLAPLLAALVVAARLRSLRPLVSLEMLTIGALGAAYLALILLAHPAYLDIVVPLARATYDGYDAPLRSMLPDEIGFAALLVLCVILAARSRAAPVGPAAVLAAAGIAFLAAYLLQHKGWDYQLVPASAYLALSGVALAAALLERRRMPLVAGAAAMPFTLLIAFALLIEGRFARPEETAAKSEIADLVTGQSFVTLNTDLHLNFPLANQLGVAWASRFPCLWPLPGLLKRAASDDPAHRAAGEAAAGVLRRMVAEDFRRLQPRFVLVPDGTASRYMPAGFDIIAFLAADPAFAAEWTRYRRLRLLAAGALWERLPAQGLR
jgi:hypothetical protein